MLPCLPNGTDRNLAFSLPSPVKNPLSENMPPNSRRVAELPGRSADCAFYDALFVRTLRIPCFKNVQQSLCLIHKIEQRVKKWCLARIKKPWLWGYFPAVFLCAFRADALGRVSCSNTSPRAKISTSAQSNLFMTQNEKRKRLSHSQNFVSVLVIKPIPAVRTRRFA